MRLFAIVFCLLAATGCLRDSPTTPSPVDSQLVLAPGQSATVEGAGVRIRFDGVTGDSRCPADVVCVLGGDAIVRITVSAPRDGEHGFELHTGSMAPVKYQSLTIALVELTPYPFSARPIDPADYRATLRVTR